MPASTNKRRVPLKTGRILGLPRNVPENLDNNDRCHGHYLCRPSSPSLSPSYYLLPRSSLPAFPGQSLTLPRTGG